MDSTNNITFEHILVRTMDSTNNITIEHILLRTMDSTNEKAIRLSSDGFVLPQGLEPWTPTLRVSCSTN